MLLSSPPHGWRGRDDKGDGAFLASRLRTRDGKPFHDFHWGRDAICIPGEEWRVPCGGMLLRRRRPYPSDLVWDGYLLRTEWGGLLTEFYVEVYPDLLGVEVARGQVIGRAQNISLKYGPGMLAHIHREVRLPNGWRIPNSWVMDVDYARRTDGAYPGTYGDPAKLEAA